MPTKYGDPGVGDDVIVFAMQSDGCVFSIRGTLMEARACERLMCDGTVHKYREFMVTQANGLRRVLTGSHVVFANNDGSYELRKVLDELFGTAQPPPDAAPKQQNTDEPVEMPF